VTYSLTAFTQCYSNSRDSRNPSCPVCQDSFNELAQALPFAHCSQSRLVCAISGLPLNEHNLPMMLPNGYVYGEQVSFDLSELGVIKVERCTPVEYVYFSKSALSYFACLIGLDVHLLQIHLFRPNWTIDFTLQIVRKNFPLYSIKYSQYLSIFQIKVLYQSDTYILCPMLVFLQ
jgi:hypothetical protein